MNADTITISLEGKVSTNTRGGKHSFRIDPDNPDADLIQWLRGKKVSITIEVVQ